MYRLAQSVVHGSFFALTLSMLAACSAADTGTLTPQEAARWLYQTCGVTFARDPQVLKGAALKPTPRQSWSVFVSGTVALPEKECELDTSLHVLYFRYTQ